MKVKKRSGRTVKFDRSKISNAIKKAFKAAGREEDELLYPSAIAASVEAKLLSAGKDIVSIDEIQDLVEKELMLLPQLADIAKRYIIYRDTRDKDRYSINKLNQVYNDVINVEKNDLTKSNANINSSTPAGMLYIAGSESSKEYACNYLINPKFVEAYKDNYIHIHDLDYYSFKAWNCLHTSLCDLFRRKYIYTSDSVIRQPQHLSTYGSMAAISLQSSQNEMYGGQSICDIDYALAEGVRKDFRNSFKKYFAVMQELNGNDKPLVATDDEIYIGNDEIKHCYSWCYEKAYEDVIKEAHEVAVALIHNYCTLHSRSGNQVVFSSINYGTDFSPEGQIIINALLDAVDEGLGNHSTAIFPISVFKLKNKISFSEADWKLAKENWDDAVNGKIKFEAPNFHLFLKACAVSAHRLFPNFLNLDAPFNQNDAWDINDPERWRHEVATMGCRTRVFEDINGEKTSARRGNLSFTTINLVKLAIESMLAEENEAKRVDLFFEKLTYYVNLVHDQLKERFEWQCSAYVKQFPYVMKNELIKSSETIKDFENGKNGYEILRHGTLGIGYIGLAECLKALIGQHHGESDRAQALGLKIIGHINTMCKEFTEAERINYGCFASPAEGLSGKFTVKDRAQFGMLEGITDRDYYTNSNHVPVYYPISAIEKIKKEAPYHALATSGNITYLEMDSLPRNNVKAFAELVLAMYHNNIGYGAINHSVDRCNQCGFDGEFEGACPECGCTDTSHIRRITGYLTGDIDKKWNSAKIAELHDRIKHI